MAAPVPPDPFSPTRPIPAAADDLYQQNLHRITSFIVYHLGIRFASLFNEGIALKAGIPTFCGHPDRQRNVFSEDPNVFLNTLSQKLNQYVWTIFQPITKFAIRLGLKLIYNQAYLAIHQIAMAIIQDKDTYLDELKTNYDSVSQRVIEEIDIILKDIFDTYKKANRTSTGSFSKLSVEERCILTEAFIAIHNPSFTLNTDLETAIKRNGYDLDETITKVAGWAIAKQITLEESGIDITNPIPRTWEDFKTTIRQKVPAYSEPIINKIRKVLIQIQIEENAGNFPIIRVSFEERSERYRQSIWNTQKSAVVSTLIRQKKFKDHADFEMQCEKFITSYLAYQQLQYLSVLQVEARFKAVQKRGYSSLRELDHDIITRVWGHTDQKAQIEYILIETLKFLFPCVDGQRPIHYINYKNKIMPYLRFNGYQATFCTSRQLPNGTIEKLTTKSAQNLATIIEEYHDRIAFKKGRLKDETCNFYELLEADTQTIASSLQATPRFKVLTQFYSQLLSAIINQYLIRINFQLVRAPEAKALHIWRRWTQDIDNAPILKHLCYKIIGFAHAIFGYLLAATIGRLYNILMPQLILFFVQKYLADIATLIFENLEKTLIEKEAAKQFLFENLNALLTKKGGGDKQPYKSNKKLTQAIDALLKTVYQFTDSKLVKVADYAYHSTIVESIERALLTYLSDRSSIDAMLKALCISVKNLFDKWNTISAGAEDMRKAARQEECKFYTETLRTFLSPVTPTVALSRNPLPFLWSQIKYICQKPTEFALHSLSKSRVKKLLDPLHHPVTVMAFTHRFVNMTTQFLQSRPIS